MDRIKDWLARIATFVIVFVVFIYVINLWDVDPLPGRILLAQQRDSIGGDAHNLLYLFAGLNAPRGESPYRAGREVIEYQRREARSFLLHGFNYLLSHKSHYGTVEPSDPSSKDVYVPSTSLNCKADCLRQYAAHRATIESDLHRYGWLLDRLHQGYRDRYSDASGDVGNVAGYLCPINGDVERLEFARIGLLAVEGNRSAAIDALVSYDRFWRQLAEDAPTIFPRMIALAYINQGIRLASDMARTLPLTPSQRNALIVLARPLPRAALDFRDVAYHNYRQLDTLTLAGFSQDIGWHNSGILSTRWWMTPIDILVRPLLQREDFRNLLYRDYLQEDDMMVADTSGLRKAIERARADEIVRPAWDWIYDPLGKYENAEVRGMFYLFPLYTKAEAHNIDLKLMLLRLQLGAGNTKALVRAAAKTINPVSGKPVQYDPKTGMLETKGLAQSDGEAVLGHAVRLYGVQTPATEQGTERRTMRTK